MCGKRKRKEILEELEGEVVREASVGRRGGTERKCRGKVLEREGIL